MEGEFELIDITTVDYLYQKEILSLLILVATFRNESSRFAEF